MRNTLVHRYLEEDIRTFEESFDNRDTPDFWINTEWEFSECNRQSLMDQFLRVKDKTKVIVEIGVSRITKIQSYEQTSTSILLNHKNPDTIYLGIDIEDKSFLKGENVYTLQQRSENYEGVLKKFIEIGIHKIDFLFIDGWHSINQVIDELWYVDFMKAGGIIGYHDTNFHPGPSKIIRAFRTDVFKVTKNCDRQNDWGIGFAELL